MELPLWHGLIHLHVVDKNRGMWKSGNCQAIKTRISIHTYLLSTEAKCSIITVLVTGSGVVFSTDCEGSAEPG